MTNNLTTLSNKNAQTLNGVIGGLLYVPDVSTIATCNAQQYDFIPRNVTHLDKLPPTNYNLVAIAPWFSIDCTIAYLNSARFDPIRAFIFYKPNNSTDKPQGPDSAVWNLDDGGSWKDSNFPIFAVPGLEGNRMMTQLGLYSGTVDQVPHGQQISQKYQPNEHDYVRIWTELTMDGNSSLPSLWVYFLIVIGALLFIVASVSLTMHFVQRRRRVSLRKRVEAGEVDLEAMGIKRLTVPASHVKDFPLFTYTSDPEMARTPSTPTSEGFGSTIQSSRHSRKKRRQNDRGSASSDTVAPESIQSLRSKRSSVGGNADTTATNFQPQCHICLVEFEDRYTIIRELPCHHIFHPVCIDEFLTRNSSLCPMCKHSMLPRGYSPKITNAMVRRERALRRLRERVEFDDYSLESGESKIKGWSKRFFHSSSPTSDADVQLEHIDSSKQQTSSTDPSSDDAPSPGGDSGGGGQETVPASTSPTDPTQPTQPRPTAKPSRPRKKAKARGINVLPTQPEGSELKSRFVGRSSPSSFARERMREIAEQNAPFDDPDQSRPKCKLIKLPFPDII